MAAVCVGLQRIPAGAGVAGAASDVRPQDLAAVWPLVPLVGGREWCQVQWEASVVRQGSKQGEEEPEPLSSAPVAPAQ